ELAGEKISAAALLAMSAVAAVPTNANALTRHPFGNAGTHGANHAGHFMSWHARIRNVREQSLLVHRIAGTNTAGLHFNAHLPGSRLGNRPLDNFKRSIGSGNLSNSHGSHVSFTFLDGLDS